MHNPVTVGVIADTPHPENTVLVRIADDTGAHHDVALSISDALALAEMLLSAVAAE